MALDCNTFVALCKGIWNPDSQKLFLWNAESWALDNGIQLKESGTSPSIGIQSPSSTCKDSGINGLGFSYMGQPWNLMRFEDERET